jgi:hypothetical protein
MRVPLEKQHSKPSVRATTAIEKGVYLRTCEQLGSHGTIVAAGPLASSWQVFFEIIDLSAGRLDIILSKV